MGYVGGEKARHVGGRRWDMLGEHCARKFEYEHALNLAAFAVPKVCALTPLKSPHKVAKCKGTFVFIWVLMGQGFSWGLVALLRPFVEKTCFLLNFLSGFLWVFMDSRGF